MPYADPVAQREYQRNWIATRRAEWFSDKQCARCGSTTRLDLHHRDPGAKVAHKVWSWSHERREAELAKCEALCEACHNEEHNGARRLPCGNAQTYRRGCRCDACREAQSLRMRDYQLRVSRGPVSCR